MIKTFKMNSGFLSLWVVLITTIITITTLPTTDAFMTTATTVRRHTSSSSSSSSGSSVTRPFVQLQKSSVRHVEALASRTTTTANSWNRQYHSHHHHRHVSSRMMMTSNNVDASSEDGKKTNEDDDKNLETTESSSSSSIDEVDPHLPPPPTTTTTEVVAAAAADVLLKDEKVVVKSKNPFQRFQNKNKDDLTFRQKLAKAGLSVVLSYGALSNLSYGISMSLAWYGFTKKTGLSPLAPNQWKPFLAVYSAFFVFNNIVRPIRFAASVAVSPYFESLILFVQERTKLSRAWSIGICVILVNIMGTIGLMTTGISLASAASGVAIFPK